MNKSTISLSESRSSIHPEHPPLLVSKLEAARALSISPRQFERIIRQREIPVVRIGFRVLIKWSDLSAYVDRKARESLHEGFQESGWQLAPMAYPRRPKGPAIVQDGTK